MSSKTITQYLKDVESQHQLTPTQHHGIKQIVTYLESLLNVVLPGTRLFVYGSVLTSIVSNQTDLDISVEIPAIYKMYHNPTVFTPTSRGTTHRPPLHLHQLRQFYAGVVFAVLNLAANMRTASGTTLFQPRARIASSSLQQAALAAYQHVVQVPHYPTVSGLGLPYGDKRYHHAMPDSHRDLVRSYLDTAITPEHQVGLGLVVSLYKNLDPKTNPNVAQYLSKHTQQLLNIHNAQYADITTTTAPATTTTTPPPITGLELWSATRYPIVHFATTLPQTPTTTGVSVVTTRHRDRTRYAYTFGDTSPHRRLEVDLNIASLSAYYTAILLRRYCELDERVRLFLLCIKLYVKAQGIGSAKEYYLGPYAYQLMCIFLLQQLKIVPTIQQVHYTSKGDVFYQNALIGNISQQKQQQQQSQQPQQSSTLLTQQGTMQDITPIILRDEDLSTLIPTNSHNRWYQPTMTMHKLLKENRTTLANRHYDKSTKYPQLNNNNTNAVGGTQDMFTHFPTTSPYDQLSDDMLQRFQHASQQKQQIDQPEKEQDGEQQPEDEQEEKQLISTTTTTTTPAPQLLAITPSFPDPTPSRTELFTPAEIAAKAKWVYGENVYFCDNLEALLLVTQHLQTQHNTQHITLTALIQHFFSFFSTFTQNKGVMCIKTATLLPTLATMRNWDVEHFNGFFYIQCPFNPAYNVTRAVKDMRGDIIVSKFRQTAAKLRQIGRIDGDAATAAALIKILFE